MCVCVACSRYITSVRGQLESQCAVPSVKCFLGDQRRPLRGKIKRLFEEDTSTATTTTTTLLPLQQHPPPPPPPPRLHGFHCSDCLICKDVSCRCDGDPVFLEFLQLRPTGFEHESDLGMFYSGRRPSLGVSRLLSAFPIDGEVYTLWSERGHAVLS